MYKIFLDDVRMPVGDDWHIVRNYDEFVHAIKTYGIPKYISFDHDLAFEHYADMQSQEKTGYDCAKFLVDFCMDRKLQLPDYGVHSMNPVGKANILHLLKNAEKYLQFLETCDGK